MLPILEQWTETNAFFIWLRESPSIWAYPTVFFVHTLGLIFTAGACIIINMRLLGAAPQLPVPALARFYRPIWIAFWLTVASGVVMLGTDLQARLINHLFPVKMLFVVTAVVLTAVMRRRIEQWNARPPASSTSSTRVLAAASLVCWLGAIAAGRFMAYFQ